MKRFAVFCLIPALLVGCGKSREDWVQEIVGKRLKDPASAQYSDIRIHPSPTWAVACGKVNAKNSFGAYEGPVGFIKFTGIGVRFEQPGDQVALSDCCDVLMAYTPTPYGDVEKSPGYAKTCGRLQLLETLR